MMEAKPKTWLFGLTADEWFHLAAEGDESEVAPCCGNISDFREALNWLAICQETDTQGEPAGWAYTAALHVLDLWRAAAEDFDNDPDLESFPLLKRVLAGCVKLRPNFVEELGRADDNKELLESLEQMISGDGRVLRPAQTEEEEDKAASGQEQG